MATSGGGRGCSTTASATWCSADGSRSGVATRGGPAAVWAAGASPAHGVGLRSGSSVEYRIVRVDGSLVGTVEEARAFESVHPGAVYLHQGVDWRVVHLDLADRAAVVEPDGTEWTMARTEIDIRTGEVDDEQGLGDLVLRLGWVEVESRVIGYQRRATGSGEVVGRAALDLPPTRLVTRAFWYCVDDHVLLRAGLDPSGGRARSTPSSTPPSASCPCSPSATGGTSAASRPCRSRAPLPGRARPGDRDLRRLPGRRRMAELGYSAADRHLAATLEVLTGCPCEDGCPSCVQSPKCGNWNEPLDKDGAIRLLRAALP